MAFSAYKYFKELPDWAKGVTVVGVLALGYIGTAFVIRKIKERSQGKLQRQVVKDADAELRVLQNSGQRPTFSQSQYSAWASQIKTAFDGCDPQSDDYDTVIRIMEQMNNDADVLSLITAFGTQTWDECGWLTGDVTGDLAYGIAHEINGISDINKVLQKKGIKFRF